MTYSILKLEKNTGTLGIAVASGSIAIATRVPWTKKELGAIATHAYTNTTHGAEVLKPLEKGSDPPGALSNLQKIARESPRLYLRDECSLGGR